MAKTVDVPHELREFNEAFNKLGGYRWDVAEVFHDLLDFMIACWSPRGDKELAERLKRKYKDDYHYLSAMMAALLRCYKFQFLNGTIKSLSFLTLSAKNFSFNPKMVRLKVATQLLKRCTRHVSIPKWYD